MSEHRCEFAAIHCIDFRFRSKTTKFLENLFGTEDFDLYSWPGAAKKIVDNTTIEACMKDIGICVNLHSAKRLAIISHLDCGAYGGSKAFNSPEQEVEVMEGDLRKARDIVRESFPELDVELYLFDPSTGNCNSVS